MAKQQQLVSRTRASLHAAPATTKAAIPKGNKAWGPGRQLDAFSELLQFERRGFVVVRQLLDTDGDQWQGLQATLKATVEASRLKALQHRVRVLCGPRVKTMPASVQECLQVLSRHSTDDLGFLQFFNNWETHEVVRSLVASEALAGAAAQLLGVRKLRLFQDCAFYKEPGYHETNWHSDLRMTPLDTNSFITAWIPLRPILGESPASQQQHQHQQQQPASPRSPDSTPQQPQRRKSSHRAGGKQPPLTPDQLQDSGLLFAAGSHRDFALPFWHDMRGMDLSGRNYQLCSTGAMDVGDVSFHHGWTLHAAGPQHPGTPPRTALAVSYFADGTRLLARASPNVYKHMMHSEDAESYQDWLSELKKDGQLAAHPKLPVVYG